MSAGPPSTRDQLKKLLDLIRKMLRHFWLMAAIVVVGAGLSVALALTQKPTYQSEAVLLYQEKISQSVLQGREAAAGGRAQSSRFREMLLSRTTLSAVVDEFKLFPDVVDEQGTIAAAEKLRTRVSFSDRGAGTFRISYIGDTKEEAQQVTARLAALLKAKDESVRKEQAEQTKKFLESEKAAAENALLDAESAFAAFVTEHPEFVAETVVPGANSVGASIRAAEKESSEKRATGTSRLATLQRAAARLRERIANPDAPVTAPVNRKNRVESPALQAARADLDEAKRSYEDKAARFTAKHPDVIAAKNYVAESERRLKRMQAAENSQPLDDDPTPTPKAKTSIEDLRRELARVENEIARVRANGDSGKGGDESLANELVSLETEHARLQRRVGVASQRLASLESRAFTADITASSEFAEASQLVIIDEAYLPSRPMGKGRKIIAIAGTLVFGLLALGLALGLALIDERVYRREDIDELGIAPVLVVIPSLSKASKSSKKNSRKRRTGEVHG